jgi:hypothetical protein
MLSEVLARPASPGSDSLGSQETTSNEFIREFTLPDRICI